MFAAWVPDWLWPECRQCHQRISLSFSAEMLPRNFARLRRCLRNAKENDVLAVGRLVDPLLMASRTACRLSKLPGRQATCHYRCVAPVDELIAAAGSKHTNWLIILIGDHHAAPAVPAVINQTGKGLRYLSELLSVGGPSAAGVATSVASPPRLTATGPVLADKSASPRRYHRESDPNQVGQSLRQATQESNTAAAEVPGSSAIFDSLAPPPSTIAWPPMAPAWGVVSNGESTPESQPLPNPITSVD